MIYVILQSIKLQEMNIKIISINKFNQSLLKDDFYKYVKRIKNNIDLIEIEPKKKYVNNIELTKKNEADLIIKNISKNSYNIALDVNGKLVDSIDFCNIIKQHSSYSEITFIIGGAYGLDKDILSKADQIISLSKLTFPHIMARLILIEQIYRSYTIINNHPYHK